MTYPIVKKLNQKIVDALAEDLGVQHVEAFFAQGITTKIIMQVTAGFAKGMEVHEQIDWSRDDIEDIVRLLIRRVQRQQLNNTWLDE